MPRTVYETTVARTFIRIVALLFFKLTGWKTAGVRPDLPKCVIIAAPHTSNWDFLYTLCVAFLLHLKPVIMMKDEWFFWPLGAIFRWFGAIPVDRSGKKNIVAQSIQAFSDSENLMMVVAPSGTRKKVIYWKTGFYRIAHGAGVPIVLGFLDYGRKTGGIGPAIHPTGNIQEDMDKIRGFYADMKGKNPRTESVVTIVQNPFQSG
jgi:1-acyl-sn-glycerol-3-phosphate acyltransferase